MNQIEALNLMEGMTDLQIAIIKKIAELVKEKDLIAKEHGAENRWRVYKLRLAEQKELLPEMTDEEVSDEMWRNLSQIAHFAVHRVKHNLTHYDKWVLKFQKGNLSGTLYIMVDGDMLDAYRALTK